MMTLGCVKEEHAIDDVVDEPAGPQRWLVVPAHPDDEIKVAPLLLKKRKPEDEMIFLVMRLTGESGPGKGHTPKESIVIRTAEMEQSARFFNAELRWWRPPHPENENIAKTPETVAKMVKLMQDIKPTRVVNHWHKDFHPDHIGTAQVVNAAVKQLKVPGGLPVYYFGSPDRKKVQSNLIPNLYVDISNPDDLAFAVWSMFNHQSQANLKWLKAFLRSYKNHGQKAGTEYADGYVVRRM